MPWNEWIKAKKKIYEKECINWNEHCTSSINRCENDDDKKNAAMFDVSWRNLQSVGFYVNIHASIYNFLRGCIR